MSLISNNKLNFQFLADHPEIVEKDANPSSYAPFFQWLATSGFKDQRLNTLLTEHTFRDLAVPRLMKENENRSFGKVDVAKILNAFKKEEENM